MRKFEGASLRTYTKRVGVEVQTIWAQFKRSILIFATIISVIGPLSLMGQTAQAAQITSRSLAISSAVASASTTYTFTFTPGTAGPIGSFTIQLCTTAVGSCTAPTSANIKGGSITGLATTGWQGTFGSAAQDTTTTTPVDCTQNNDYCYKTNNTSTSQTITAHTITISSVTNPSTTGTFYGRIITYSDAAYATPVDNGNVAAATTTTFNVSAVVQEQLTFCVGAVNGTAAAVESASGTLPACGSLLAPNLSLGTLSSTAVNYSPVSTSQPYNGNSYNGAAELSTNAAGGTTISYNAISQGSGAHPAALRVPSATCIAGNSYVDQCINSVTAGTTIAAGTEDFGMAIPGISCTNVTAYTCTASSHNLVVQSPYYCAAGDATTSFSTVDSNANGQISGTTNCTYAWDDSGTSETVASSSSSTSKVVGGEGLILEFAAAPEATTPTGSYSAEANFVATPTY